MTDRREVMDAVLDAWVSAEPSKWQSWLHVMAANEWDAEAIQIAVMRLIQRGKRDAKIIADLLAACEAAYVALTDIERYGEHKDNPLPIMLRAAIAKAKGEQMEHTP